MRFITSTSTPTKKKPPVAASPPSSITAFPAQPTTPPPRVWAHRFTPDAWQQVLHASWRTAGLSGGDCAIDGKLVLPCPRCTAMLKVEERMVSCTCHWSAKGEPWEIAQAAAAAKTAGTAVTADGTLPDEDTDAWSIMSFKVPPENDPDELLKHRFLCRGGALLLVGPTGVGKSSLSMQLMMAWALGRAALGITPARPLKSLLIQAENDGGDIAEFREGVVGGMGLTAKERDAVGEMVLVKMEDARAGDEFIAFARVMVERHRPDLLWIDPAFAYLGGESNSAQDVGHFLRQGLNPIIHEFQCGVVVIHHTAKPMRAVNGGGVAQDNPSYAGSGSAEWSNWSRATLTLENMGDGRFSLVGGKRKSRLRWKDESGDAVYQQVISHCKEDGKIWWETLTADEAAEAAARGGKSQKLAKKRLTPEQVADVLGRAGGKVRGGVNSPDGLVAMVRRAFEVSRDEAATAVDRALGETIQYVDESVRGGLNGGRVYILKGVKSED